MHILSLDVAHSISTAQHATPCILPYLIHTFYAPQVVHYRQYWQVQWWPSCSSHCSLLGSLLERCCWEERHTRKECCHRGTHRSRRVVLLSQAKQERKRRLQRSTLMMLSVTTPPLTGEWLCTRSWTRGIRTMSVYTLS